MASEPHRTENRARRAELAGATRSHAVSAAGLTRAYPGGLWRPAVTVLSGVDLALAPGARLGLLGPNGSGKSTLLRLLSGIDRPSHGQLSVFGASPERPDTRARIGYLAEDSPFPPELSARAALDLVARIHGVARAERSGRVEGALSRVGLERDARKRLGRFSKGMLRRFGLAQATLHDPELLLLDEPTAGLDAPGLDVLAELLNESRARGMTLVMASHRLSDLIDHCESVLVLVAGSPVASGTLEELLSAGRTHWEIEGLGEPQRARLASEIESLGGRVVALGPADSALLELYRRLGGAGP